MNLPGVASIRKNTGIKFKNMQKSVWLMGQEQIKKNAQEKFLFLAMAKKLRDEGNSLRNIANILNERGFRYRKKKFNHMLIKRILEHGK